MIGALAAVYVLLDAVGNGQKGSGLKQYLSDNFPKISRSIMDKKH